MNLAGGVSDSRSLHFTRDKIDSMSSLGSGKSFKLDAQLRFFVDSEFNFSLLALMSFKTSNTCDFECTNGESVSKEHSPPNKNTLIKPPIYIL